MLGGFCMVTLLLNVLSWLCFVREYSSVWSFLDVHHGTEILLSSAVLVLVLRTEPLARVFRIDRKRLLGLALAIPAGVAGFALLGAILMLPLWWLGLVKLGPNVNRFLSTETPLRFDSWGWKVPLVILGATAEEVLFRGVLHDALRRRVPTLAAAVLGSFVFAAVHTRPLDFSVGPFAIGLILVLLREKFRSLTPPAVCHCLWNFMILSLR